MNTYSEEWVNGAIWAAQNLNLTYDQLDRLSSNLILRTDSYKFSHWKMYSELRTVYSYFESRSGALFPETVFCGLQPILIKMTGSIITRIDIEEADEFCKSHFGLDGMFNRDMWLYIVEELHGRLPLRIKAVPEGTPVPISNVLLTVENTDPKCASLTNHFETWLTHIWYTSTVATLSRSVKVILKSYLDLNSDTDAGLAFMLHDFGYRGVSSVESAGYGCLGHLVNFMGTDTVEGVMYARRYYGETMAGYSVPASEHSVMTSKGREGEYQVIANLINIYPQGVLSLVLDSFNIYKACEHIGTVLKEAVLARDGKLVVRPDSGHPPEVIYIYLYIYIR
jgi:nicotinamide phosphoribosyltransferase